MDLSDFFVEIAATYDRSAGLSTPAQALLRRASDQLGEHATGGILVIGSGGKGTATFTPWVGFFDPDETVSPEAGLYVVYLVTEDLGTLLLTLMQGITELSNTLGNAAARVRLAEEAHAIRSKLPADAIAGLDTGLDLGSRGFRQRAYEAGTVVSRRYSLDTLPAEPELRADLTRFLHVYQLAAAVKRELLLTSPGAISSSSSGTTFVVTDPLRDFKPKSDADYQAFLTGRSMTKSRRHEGLVREYGLWVSKQGWVPSNPHPKDLVLLRRSKEWLVEAKVLYQGNATDAVRAALGQLYAYRHFLGPATSALLALFSEPIGNAYVRFLETCGVASVWKENTQWLGSAGAVTAGLAEAP